MPLPTPWRQTTDRILALREEAIGFLERAAQRFSSASLEHFPLVARLWLAAEEADPLIHRLLQGMDREMLGGHGKLDVSRGAYVLQAPSEPGGDAAPSAPEIDWQAFGFPQSPFLRAQAPPASPIMASSPLPSEEVLVYNCAWSLRWEQEHGVTADLGITAGEGQLTLRVLGERSRHEQRLCYPADEGVVRVALATAYVAEQLVDEAPKARASPAVPRSARPKARKRARAGRGR